MPIVTIQSPTGQSFKIEAPEGATDEQILRFAKSQGLFDVQTQTDPSDLPPGDLAPSLAQPKPESSLGEKALGALEALGTLATGATTGALGFLGGSVAGAAGELLGITPDGEKVATETAAALTFQPKTEFGQELVKDIGDVLGALPPVMGGAPVASAQAMTLPTVKGLRQLGRAKRAGQRVLQSASKTKQALAEEIKAGNRNAGNIAMQLDADGTLIKNPNVKSAIKLMGDNDAAYSSAINFEKMNSATRKQVNKMLDVIENNKKSGDPTQIMTNRPADVIGEALAQRAIDLNKIKTNASKRIGNLINGELGDKQANISKARDNFISALKEADIDIGVQNNKLIANTERTLTNVNEVVSQDRLNNVLNRIKSGNINAREAHKLKRNLREMVSFDATAPGAAKVSQEIENAFKSLASDLNDSIGKLDSRYAKANKGMADSLGALKETDRLLGRGVMIGDDLAVSKLGALSKRIGSNLATREQIISLVDNLDESLGKFKKRPQDDIRQQVAALADLEKIFKVEGEQSPFGFQARIAQGAADAITGTPTGAGKQLLDAAINKFRTMNELEFDDKMKALRALSKVK